MSKTQIRNSSQLDYKQGFMEPNSGLQAQNSNHNTDQFNKTDTSQLNRDVEQYIQGVNMSSKSGFDKSAQKVQQKNTDYGYVIDNANAYHEKRESIDFNSSPSNRNFIGGSKFPRNQSFVGLRKHSLEKQAKLHQDALQKQ